MPVLGKEEVVVLEREAKYEGGGGIKIPGRKKGVLILTNKRIIFEYAQGLFSKKIFTPLNEPISKIINVHSEGVISKKLVIELEKSEMDKKSGRTGRVKFSTYNVDEWVREIHRLMTEG